MKGLIPQHRAHVQQRSIHLPLAQSCGGVYPLTWHFLCDNYVANQVFHDKLYCCIRHFPVCTCVYSRFIFVFCLLGSVELVQIVSVFLVLFIQILLILKYIMFKIDTALGSSWPYLVAAVFYGCMSCVEHNQPTAPHQNTQTHTHTT